MASKFKMGDYLVNYDDKELEILKLVGDLPTVGATIKSTSNGTFLHIAIESGKSVEIKLSDFKLTISSELCKLIIKEIETFEKKEDIDLELKCEGILGALMSRIEN